MQREACRKPHERLEAIAVQDGRMMVTRFDHDEQVERIGIELRVVRQLIGAPMLNA
jgi:hypothetical protein